MRGTNILPAEPLHHLHELGGNRRGVGLFLPDIDGGERRIAVPLPSILRGEDNGRTHFHGIYDRNDVTTLPQDDSCAGANLPVHYTPRVDARHIVDCATAQMGWLDFHAGNEFARRTRIPFHIDDLGEFGFAIRGLPGHGVFRIALSHTRQRVICANDEAVHIVFGLCAPLGKKCGQGYRIQTIGED